MPGALPRAVGGLALAALLAACGADAEDAAAEAAWFVDTPAHFPAPVVPADNPLTAAKVELGRFLFYDVRFSGNGTQSCGSCHLQALAFTDGKVVSEGSTGELHPRNAMALVNTAYNSAYTWANPALVTLEQQIMVPIFGEFPIELGVTGFEDVVLDRLRADARYPALFAAAFPERDDPISIDAAVDALASFVRALVSSDAPYDRFVAGDRDALSADAVEGMKLFFSEQLECHHCHGGFNFSFSTTHRGSAFVELAFHNTGLYDIDGAGSYPPTNPGLYAVTGAPGDMGRFRAPTLRNIAVTAPYMHDGSMATLDEVVAAYARGGRLIESGPHAGDGRDNPYKDGFVQGFTLGATQQRQLVAFLESLTDERFLTNPAYADPFAR